MAIFRLDRLFLVALLAAAEPGCAQPSVPADVQAVIDRSRNSRANYAVHLTTEVVRGDQRTIEMNAEFQQGAMHRVEVPDARVLANCDTGDQFYYDVHQRQLANKPEASGGACGIAVGADQPISGRMLEPISGPFGRADVIELVGTNFVRRYAVTEDGIIVSNEYAPRRPDVPFALKTLSAKVIRGTQDGQMFQPESLDRAFAPTPDIKIPD